MAGWCEGETKGQNRLSNYETGARPPSVNDLLDLAKAMNIHISDFFPRDDRTFIDVKKQINEIDVKNMDEADFNLALDIISAIKNNRKIT